MPALLLELGLALGLIALASAVAVRLRFTPVPLVILIGMAVGPHAPRLGPLDFRFLQSAPVLDLLGRVGVLFLLFYLGLEFSFARFLQAGPAILRAGAVNVAVKAAAGGLLAASWGWGGREAAVAAGIMAVSSSAIVAKLIIDLRRAAHPETEYILGMLLVEDIAMAGYLAVVTGLLARAGGPAGGGGLAGGVAAAGLALAALVALFLGRRVLVAAVNRALGAAGSDEVRVLVAAALLVLAGGLGTLTYVEPAVAALLLGMAVAESDHARRVEQLLLPLRDFFGAVFFFHFGLSVDPRRLPDAAGPALAGVAATLAASLLVGWWVAHRHALSGRAALAIGLTMLPRGELSVVLANLAAAAGLGARIQSFAALYVLALAVAGPVLARYAPELHRALVWAVAWRPGRRGGAAPG